MNRDGNGWVLSACAALLGNTKLSPSERKLLTNIDPLPKIEAHRLADAIKVGEDPLGSAYMEANSPEVRRASGETYTPSAIVNKMVGDAARVRTPARIVDVGCGSGRFALACARVFPAAHIIGIDISPIATLMTKASVAAAGLEGRVDVLLGDFTTTQITKGRPDEPTLWIGNPPYVRHHNISRESKEWLSDTAGKLGYKASGLSGLHAYFVLSIAERMEANDFGVLITSAEWLDVKYGSLVRLLLSENMGLTSLSLYDRSETIFDNTDTTSAVFTFDKTQAYSLGREVTLNSIGEGAQVVTLSASLLAESAKWSSLLFPHPNPPEGFVRLGSFARVHRGIATGANRFWVRSAGEKIGVPTVPVVSHARELNDCMGALNTDRLSRLIALPLDLGELEGEAAAEAEQIVAEGHRRGVDKGYIASSRRRWWSIPVGDPASILMTYMGRRPPRFVANKEGVRSLNVVHGIYPSIPMSERAVDNLVAYLNTSVSPTDGRVYCGGLTKFEPGEVENIWVPSPEMLEEESWHS